MTYPVTPTTWNPGAAPGISAEELNRIEQALTDAHNNEVDAEAFDGNSLSLTGSFADLLTLQLTIPAEWNSWKAVVWARAELQASGSGTGEFRVVIDGTNENIMRQPLADTWGFVMVMGRRTGVATTGSRTVSFQGRETSGSLNAGFIYLYARAVRTS